MSPETIRRLDDLFRTMPVLLGGPVSCGEIDAAEQHVGLKFAQDYRDFLERYGGGIVGSLPLLGLRQAEAMADDMFSVADVTDRFRAGGWKSTDEWVIISMDLAGNPIGLTLGGDVWVADHDAGETRILAPTFEDFVIQLLDE